MSKENTAAVQPKAKITLDPRFTAKLTLTLMGICAVVALLLGIVNNMTEPIIEEIQAEKRRAGGICGGSHRQRFRRDSEHGSRCGHGRCCYRRVCHR